MSCLNAPFKPPQKVKGLPAARPTRVAATDCREKLVAEMSSDEDDYFSQATSYSSSASEKKRPLGDRTNLVSQKKPNLNGGLPAISPPKGMPLGISKANYPSSYALLSKPFKPPYKDPKRRAELSHINPHSVVLGLRPLFNHHSLFNPLHDPDEPDALVLYRPAKTISESEKITLASRLTLALAGKGASEGGLDEIPELPVVVDPKLAKVLRPHQVEGVKFLYNCVTGRQVEGAYGCIMADEMGLGKTLQCITLLWTLLKQSPIPRKVTADKVVIACPMKWLGEGKIKPITCDHKASALHTAKEQLKMDLQRFLGISRRNSGNEVLIISYETLRGNVEELGKQPIGLLLCDEGHRLKNASNQTYLALNSLNVKRRVVLTGTPIQNDLSEYFALLNFANPNLLGTPSEFRRNYETPIMLGRDALATERERQVGDEKLQQLNTLVGPCIIRRTNDLLSKYLPTKYEHVVFCKLSPVQKRLYDFFLNSKAAKKLLAGTDTQPLQSITLLKKLSNHPSLLNLLEDLPGCDEILPELVLERAAAGCRAMRVSARDGGGSSVHVEWSSKLTLLDSMLSEIKRRTSDKVVLISNYTQTLDLFERLCQLRSYTFLRLDGKMSTTKRQKLVDRFNDPFGTDFVFLLSSKAGGCGINLIGANRLILFDPDWNPAADQQALARVWRDGQKKTCYIYRLIAAGTIEEKIFQRQSHKQTLSSCVVDEETELDRHFSKNDLRDLFTNNTACLTDTHNTYKCSFGCDRADRPNTTYGDLSSWTHLSARDRLRLADNVLKCAAADSEILTYVFQYKSHDPIKV
ncbi:DNA-dependent ATPase protein rad54 [Massospora cicadina]|nr:DNA-dependent ATPase protein rad54 [Massospora cicadina]